MSTSTSRARRRGGRAGRLVRRPVPEREQRVPPISSEIHEKADGSLYWEFDLVGVIDADDPAQVGNTDMVLINVAHFDEARKFAKGKTGWYIVRVADAGQAPTISAEIDTLGFSDGKVTALVLAEAFLMLLLGAALGMVAAPSAMPMLNGKTGGRFPPLFVSPETWISLSTIPQGSARRW